MNLLEQLDLPDLDAHLVWVESELHHAVDSTDAFLAEVAGHLIAAGGKRLRPMLSLASAAAAGAAVGAEVVQGAVAVELVHLGSLYHDDVIDAADSRRGVPSVNSRWGNLIAILAGDFLLARASELAAGLGAEVAGLLGATISRLCEGEVSQLKHAFDTARGESAYLSSIEGKTASLLATSARIGALVSGAPRAVVETLTGFGRAFGMAFQIWDDISDLLRTNDELGKPAGRDLVEGTYTLPVIRALGVPSAADELLPLLGQPLDLPTVDKAREIILSTDAVLSSIVLARAYADQAASALAPLRDGPGAAMVPSLARLAHHLVDSIEVP